MAIEKRPTRFTQAIYHLHFDYSILLRALFRQNAPFPLKSRQLTVFRDQITVENVEKLVFMYLKSRALRDAEADTAEDNEEEQKQIEDKRPHGVKDYVKGEVRSSN
jgi:hypothetical protein